ncbi:hypothetical protein RCL1_000386 [Eukaryota sp. TZLM3-RCL]
MPRNWQLIASTLTSDNLPDDAEEAFLAHVKETNVASPSSSALKQLGQSLLQVYSYDEAQHHIRSLIEAGSREPVAHVDSVSPSPPASPHHVQDPLPEQESPSPPASPHHVQDPCQNKSLPPLQPALITFKILCQNKSLPPLRSSYNIFLGHLPPLLCLVNRNQR